MCIPCSTERCFADGGHWPMRPCRLKVGRRMMPSAALQQHCLDSRSVLVVSAIPMRDARPAAQPPLAQVRAHCWSAYPAAQPRWLSERSHPRDLYTRGYANTHTHACTCWCVLPPLQQRGSIIRYYDYAGRLRERRNEEERSVRLNSAHIIDL